MLKKQRGGNAMKFSKTKLLVLTMLIISALVLASCVTYDAVDEDAELVDDELVDVEDIAEESDTTEDEVELDAETEEETTVEEDIEETDLTDTSDLITIEVDESDLVDLAAVVTDPDEDEVTYYFSEPLSESGNWQTNYGDAGEYEVTLTATDGVNTVEQLVLLVVNRVNVAPVIDALEDLFYAEGDDIIFIPEVEDPNGDTVIITVSAPLSEGEFETDHTSSGEYEITVTASDGELDSEATFTLSIEDVNVLPVISGVEDLEVSEGDTVTLDVEVEDLDGDNVEITISDPVGDDGVWEVSFTEHGEYSITITVDDGKDIVEETITIVVADVNMPPEIIDVSLETE